MKKRICLTILAILLVASVMASCGGNGNDETYNNITAQSNPYSAGTQSVEIKASSANPNEPAAKFKQSVSVADIELGGALEGKTVTKVVFNSETSVTVTLDGNTKTAGGEGVYGTITVKQNGMESKGNSTCTVNVRAPEIEVASFSSSNRTKDGVTTYSIIAKLALPVGSFTDDAAENITLEEGVTGEFSAELADGLLVVTVKNCEKKNPSVVLNAAATTFGKKIVVTLSFGGSAKI